MDWALIHRHRQQIIVSLGEGAEGETRRVALDAAAARAGVPLSTWARRALLDAVNLQHDEAPTRAELRALEVRVVALEGKKNP